MNQETYFQDLENAHRAPEALGIDDVCHPELRCREYAAICGSTMRWAPNPWHPPAWFAYERAA